MAGPVQVSTRGNTYTHRSVRVAHPVRCARTARHARAWRIHIYVLYGVRRAHQGRCPAPPFPAPYCCAGPWAALLPVLLLLMLTLQHV